MGTSRLGFSPASLGYVAPAEEAPHKRTWMGWPADVSIYLDDTAYFEEVQQTIGRLAAAIAEHEPVCMIADAAHHRLAREALRPEGRAGGYPDR